MKTPYKKRRIKDLPSDLRPREKLKKLGPRALTDEELLAIILGSGTKGMDVLNLAEEILKAGWKNLKNMDVSELEAFKGLGEAKACKVKALIELSERIRSPFSGRKINSPEDAFELLLDKFPKTKEALLALYMDVSHRVIDIETVAVGSLNRVFAEPRDILRRAVELSSCCLIVAHNHPAGSPEPSEDDMSFTQRLSRACEILGIELLDHLIIGEDRFFSMKEKGLI